MNSVRRGARQRGFTLIELLIIIAILGILAAILTPILVRARFKAYHTACVQNERNLASALELYAIEFTSLYPSDLNLLVSGTKPYIQTIARCPSNDASYATSYSSTADSVEYILECPGIHHLQLPGLVESTYPRASNGAIYPYRAP